MRAAFLITAAFFSAGAAQAQSSLPIETSGGVALGFADRLPESGLFLSGDLNLRLSFNRVPLGLELGVYGYADEADSPHETFGAVTWDFGNSRISAGVPHPAYDSFAVSALERSFPTIAADHAERTRSEATWGPMHDGYLPWGARFDGRSGQLSYAVSVHNVSNHDTVIGSVGLGYTSGDWDVSVALESNDDGDSSGKLQAQWHGPKVDAGLGLFAPGADDEPTFVEGFAVYRAFGAVTLSGVVQLPLDGSDVTAGLAGRYDFNERVGLSLGVASDTEADTVVNGFVGLNF
ncbi:hypothetical protein [Pseudoruegeria sp. HB172150]|uniref:hypothetical protein n=1 Tax=Pseudoruegeria sp. HB172150 TaxID=2721164 RepID=UPI001556CEF8|nr:hypothetical protein [Pseudoruegeria sp. HB172150]